MRSEHAQMRELFGELQAAIGRRDARALADAAETLFLIMQQHNVKEEKCLSDGRQDRCAWTDGAIGGTKGVA